MAEFTKEEQIQAIYDLKVGYTLGHADIAMLKAMARQLLASIEQTPVHLRPFGDDGETFVACDGNDERDITLYTAPKILQPALVSVPEVVGWEDVPEEITEDDIALASAWAHGFNQCRAAMLQGDETVTDNTNQQFESLSRGDK